MTTRYAAWLKKKQKKPLSREEHGNHIHYGYFFPGSPHHHTPSWNKMARHVASTKWGYSSCCSTYFSSFFLSLFWQSFTQKKKKTNQIKNNMKSKRETDWLTWRCKNSKINTYIHKCTAFSAYKGIFLCVGFFLECSVKDFGQDIFLLQDSR